VALRSLLVHACFQQGRLRRAIEEAQRAAQSPDLTPVEIARFEYFAAQCRFTRGDLDPAEEPAAQAMVAAEDAETRAYGLSYLACVRYMQGHYAKSVELVERARAASTDRESMPEWESGLALNRAFCLIELDRPIEAAEAFEAGTRRAEQHGSVYWSWYQLGTAEVHFLAGRWDDSLAEIKAGIDTVETLGQIRGLNSGLGLRSQAALIAVHRGELEACVALLRESDTGRREAFYGYLRLWTQALVLEAQGRPRDALDLLFDAWVDAGPLRQHRRLHYVCPDIARLAASLDDTGRGRRLADDMAQLADGRPVPSLRAAAALCRGLADGDPGRLAEAGRDYALAGRPLYQAYAAENAAVLLARAGRPREARAELAAAIELYDGLEARWDLARAERQLRPEGVQRGSRGTRRPKSGWEALTETERKIAALVAEGNSNPGIAARMFISRRTVQSHVSSILAKLDLTSRVELAVLVHQRGNG
jgi:DNA-binding CsgD family transcriptional regulator